MFLFIHFIFSTNAHVLTARMRPGRHASYPTVLVFRNVGIFFLGGGGTLQPEIFFVYHRERMRSEPRYVGAWMSKTCTAVLSDMVVSDSYFSTVAVEYHVAAEVTCRVFE